MTRYASTSATTALAALILAALPAAAQTAPAATNYRQDANWLCRPGRADACTQDLAATRVEASGAVRPVAFVPAARPPVDCFYVYPTVSLDAAANSDLVPGPEERAVIANQFARLGSTCRLFAPMYRQVTIPALRSGMMGKPMAGIDREVGYRDVLAAWRDYLARDNGGRGVILVGHSQGSGVLKRLIAEEIDGKADQTRLVGAYLLGTNLLIPAGKTVGGDFKAVPLCTAKGEVGCVVSYVSFRATTTPPANTRFGRTDRAGMKVACVNPAAIGRTAPAALDAYLGNRPAISSSQAAPPDWVRGKAVTTPFVQVPGLLTGRCVDSGGAQYLEVAVNAVPTDPRTDTISGDVLTDGKVAADWGLHVIDANVAMGDLVAAAAAQAQAFERRR